MSDLLKEGIMRYRQGLFTVVNRLIILLVMIFCSHSGLDRAWAEEEVDTARELIRKWGDAVITVKVVVTMRLTAEGRELTKMESEIEAVATVIDSTGLTVLSHSNIDPARIFGEVMKQVKPGSEEMPKFNIETEIGNAKMLLPNGNEVPAGIVMKDKDLDLVFVRPVEKLRESVNAIDLTRNTKPDVFDKMIVLSRLDRVAGRILSTSLYRIEAVVKKPRTLYVIDQNALTGRLGAPVFSSNGKVVGIFLLRVTEARDKGRGIGDMFRGMSQIGLLPVILPAEEIAGVARQAL
jgi:hypothetical protein